MSESDRVPASQGNPNPDEIQDICMEQVRAEMFRVIARELIENPPPSLGRKPIASILRKPVASVLFKQHDDPVSHSLEAILKQSWNDFFGTRPKSRLWRRCEKYTNWLKDFLPTTAIVGLFLWSFGLFSAHQSDLQQIARSRNQNDRAVMENYYNTIKEITLSTEYDEAAASLNPTIRQNPARVRDERASKEYNFINNMTIVALRELEDGSSRKSAIVLMAHKAGLIEGNSPTAKVAVAPPSQSSETTVDSQFQSKEPNYFFKGADLKFTSYIGYDLDRIDFSGADLRGSDLTKARLNAAIFSDVDLSCHDFEQQNHGTFAWIPFLPEKYLHRRQLNCASLKGASLNQANLTRANLTRANLTRADLSEADFSEADLSGANLNGAELTSAILDAVNLQGTNLQGTNLHGTKGVEADVIVQSCNWEKASFVPSRWDEQSKHWVPERGEEDANAARIQELKQAYRDVSQQPDCSQWNAV